MPNNNKNWFRTFARWQFLLFILVSLSIYGCNTNKVPSNYVANSIVIQQDITANETDQNNTKENQGEKMKMTITSKSLQNMTKLDKKFTCQGSNMNPQLEFNNVPKNAKSLVLIMDDPDAPSGDFVHWVIFNMDANTQGIAENSKPNTGIEAMTDFRRTGYSGPCPPSGVHRYFFKLYAVDIKLQLDKTATKKDVESGMIGHIIEKSELIGLYQKT